MSVARKVDAKGRVTLGVAYANLIVLIEEQRGGMLLKKVAIVPEAETVIPTPKKDTKAPHQVSALEASTDTVNNIRRMRGFLKGIDTTVHRDEDRV